jgi:hypothetical protein
MEMIKHLEAGGGKGKKARYIIISIFALVVVMGGIWLCFALLGTSIVHFLDAPSFWLLLLPLIFVLTITRSYKSFYLGLRALIFPVKQISDEQRAQAISLFRLMSKTVAIYAAIATITGFISMGLGIDFADAPTPDLLLRNVSTLMMILLYSLIMILVVFEPIVFILKKKQK